MAAQRNTYQIKKAIFTVLDMLMKFLLGLAADNIPVGFILGFSFIAGLDKHGV